MEREKKVESNLYTQVLFWCTGSVHVIKGILTEYKPSCISHGTIKTIETTHKTNDQLCPWLHVNPAYVNKTDLKASDEHGNK